MSGGATRGICHQVKHSDLAIFNRPAAVAPRFCPTIQELKVVQKQRIKARRSKLYYLRDRKASEFKV